MQNVISLDAFRARYAPATAPSAPQNAATRPTLLRALLILVGLAARPASTFGQAPKRPTRGPAVVIAFPSRKITKT